MTQDTISAGGLDFAFYSVGNLVIGSGAAGLNAAVSLFKEGARDIAIVTEGRLMGTSRNTGSDKQTYYKLTTCGEEPDSVRRMAQTLFEGQCVDGDLALCEAALSARGFYHLVDIGVPFPHNRMGEYVGYKTDHDPCKRGTSAGPLTSRYMTEALWREVEQFKIPVFDGYQVIEILTEADGQEKKAVGLVALNVKEREAARQYTVFSAENLIYATGGEAGMYDTSVYPVSQTGNTGTAFRAGARGKNLTESQYGIASVKFRWNLSGTYQQVIPRYISIYPEGGDEREFLDEYFDNPSALLSAIFLKGYQWPFDPRKIEKCGSSLIDLLVYQETVIRGRRVFLDYRRNPSCGERDGQFDVALLSDEAREYLECSGGLAATPIERLRRMNPAAIELYADHGIDLNSELLEIAVCAQHNNGGLAGDCWWESNIRHLFPVGEVNGSHGVYRPGGSALNAGQVGSMRAAQLIARRKAEGPLEAEALVKLCGTQIADCVDFGMKALRAGQAAQEQALDLAAEKKCMQMRMSRCGANIRSREAIKEALEENEAQMRRIQAGAIVVAAQMKRYYRLRDLLVSQRMYLSAILDYIDRGGKSRGSYLVCDAKGRLPAENLPEMFRFSLDEGALAGVVQEAVYDGGACRFFWRDVRPIPEEDSWLERVWKQYREGDYFE